MNNNIVPFNNAALGCSVRTVIINEEPWFVGKDVCSALGYANETDAMNRHCKGVVKRYPLQTSGGVQEIRVISEPDMMRLICGSKLESAKRFEAWVFEEVLPTIRKHGIYATGEKLLELISKPENALKVFQALKDEQDKRKSLEAKIEEDAPYTEFGKSVEVSEGCMLIGEFAKVLRRTEGKSDRTVFLSCFAMKASSGRLEIAATSRHRNMWKPVVSVSITGLSNMRAEEWKVKQLRI